MNISNKFLIIGNPRTGSSLLASVLAGAGANFGVKDQQWNRKSGAFEHPLLINTYKYLKRMKSSKSYSDRLSRYYSKKVCKNLNTLYNQVDFAKYPPLSHMLPYYCKKAGHEIRVIVSYRKFEDFATSMMIKDGLTYEQLKKDYLEMNYSAIFLLNIYGGCCVSYEELTSMSDLEWIDNLAELCSLEAELISQEINGRKKVITSSNPIQINDSECDKVYELLQKYKGKLLSPDKGKINKTV